MEQITKISITDQLKKLRKKRLSGKEINNFVKSKVKELFFQAKKEFEKSGNKRNKKSRKRVDFYVKKARKLAMKFRVKLDPELKKMFCRHCYSFLFPGVNCRVRLAKKRVIYYCLNCKRFMRFPYIKEKRRKLAAQKTRITNSNK